jgi:hypothetical protein
MLDFDMAKSDVFTDEVEIDLDVLCALVLNWVAGHVDGADVVTKDHCGTAEGGVKLKKELAEPGGLGHGVGDNTILSFGTATGDSHLSFGRPGDEVVTKKDSIARGRLPSVGTPNPICI